VRGCYAIIILPFTGFLQVLALSAPVGGISMCEVEMGKYKIQDYIGKTQWNVTPVGLGDGGKWIFECKCGNQFLSYPSRVIGGHKKSCGCTRWESKVTHRKGNSEYYHGWWSMMQRCYNEKHHNYKRYGGRGITVCEEWKNPVNFIEWAEITNGKSRNGRTLDRIDNNKGYSPDNCRWATLKDQSRNREVTKFVTIGSETKPLSEWLEIYGVDKRIFHMRVKKLGWNTVDAITTKVKKRA